jgi:hydrogenase/urease accessory protein HupE
VSRAARAAAVLLFLFGGVRRVSAHEARPGYLELRETSPGRFRVLWKPPAQGGTSARVMPVFPEGCAFRAGQGTELSPGALVTRGELTCSNGLAGKTIRTDGLETTMTDVLVLVHRADGGSETHLLRPVEPAVTFGGSTSAGQRAAAYLRLGIEHILLGVDHLLFVLGLLLIVGNRWMLLKTITSFTVAHSLTLAIATLGFASAPVQPLNASIALSILFLGPEIVRVRRGETSLTIRHPWIVAFAFGLLHGFGFASGLTAMGLPKAEIPLALLLFNVGVEVGQLAFVFLVLAISWSFRQLEIRWTRWAAALPAYAVGTLGAFWTIQRTAILMGFGR